MRKMEKTSYVYILASGMYGTLYTGVTSNLIRRVWEHREGLVEGFTKEYGVKAWSGMSSILISMPPLLEKSRSRSGAGIGRLS
jgi:hypothetical protein